NGAATSTSLVLGQTKYPTLNLQSGDLWATRATTTNAAITGIAGDRIVVTDSTSNLIASSTLSVLHGGTGQATLASGEILLGNGTSGLLSTSTLAVLHGGTGVQTVASGGLLYGNGTSAFNSLAIGAANTVLTSSGTAPQWSSSLAIPGTLSTATTTITGSLTVQDSGGANVALYVDNNLHATGIGTTDLTNAKLKIAMGGSASITDSYNDQSKIAGLTNTMVSSGSIRLTQCGDSIQDSDGNSYGTVAIGSQCWMTSNLNVGTKITSCTNGYVGVCTTGGDTVKNQTNNSVTEKYCYGDNTANCTTYGGLYQWNEAMSYSAVEGSRGICPSGWHIPTDAQF
ncbi:MAG: FISUMP domain-containing protein, partial [Kiritimatiellota bacterium]|nr:FISUMP domain-containing protein [Kiritimatiellota bacterium]